MAPRSMPTGRDVKRLIQNAIRTAHLRVARRPLGNQIALYFHALEAKDQDGFRLAIESLRARGYRIVGSPDEFLDEEGRRAWISFDDNYRSWYEAIPLLEELSVRATFYLNTQPLRDRASEQAISAYFDRIDHRGDRTPLSSAEVRKIHEAGHTIGSHTHSHHDLGSVTTSVALADLETNLDSIEEITGDRPQHFAIPFGMRRYFDPSLEQPMMGAGIRTITYAIPGMQHATPIARSLHRTPWRFDRSLSHNWEDLEVDGRWFERLTGRSAVG